MNLVIALNAIQLASNLIEQGLQLHQRIMEVAGPAIKEGRPLTPEEISAIQSHRQQGIDSMNDGLAELVENN